MAINKELALRSIFSISNNLLNVVLRFLSFFVLIRALPKDEFGIWVLFLVVVAIVEVVRNGFIKNAVVKYIASSSDENHKSIQSASLLLNFSISFVSVGVLILISTYLSNFWNAPQLKSMFTWYSLTAFFLVFFSHLEFIGAAVNKFRNILQINLIRNFSFLLFVSLSYFFGRKIELQHLVVFQAISVFIGLIAGLIIMRQIINLHTKISNYWVKKLFHFGKYVVGTNLGTVIFTSTDQIMLGAILNTESVAIYNTAIRINNLIDAPVMGISNVFYTHSSEKGESSFTTVYVSSVGAILSIIVPLLIFIYIFSGQIIYIVAGSNYSDSANILRVTMLYTFFIPFVRQFGTLSDSIGKPQINLILTIFASLINIFFSYIAVTKFGVIGAAYGTLTTYIVNFTIVLIYLKRTYNLILTDILKAFVGNYFRIYQFLIKRNS
ncbi:MAG: oligosaccharide flippase family protein [Cyclobacteriaceae bacterium]|nr:oligosaccharide flippase family protein [Cyclobacteriaceae bacterium]